MYCTESETRQFQILRLTSFRFLRISFLLRHVDDFLIYKLNWLVLRKVYARMSSNLLMKMVLILLKYCFLISAWYRRREFRTCVLTVTGATPFDRGTRSVWKVS